MAKGKLKLVREIMTNFSRCVTIGYPAEDKPETRYSQVPQTLRGKPEFDKHKCIGCGACSVRCPSRAIRYTDKNEKRAISIFLGRCLFCGQCEEVCPEDAITLTTEFELSYTNRTENPKDYVKHEVDLATCEICGSVIAPTSQIENCKQVVLDKIEANPLIRKIVAEDMEKYTRYCVGCRQRLSHEMNTHTRKYY